MTEPLAEAEKRRRRCCFTGHRPEKLRRSPDAVKADLQAAIEEAIGDGFSTFITGMARGVDLWAGELVIAAKERRPELKLICAHPHRDFEAQWSQEWKDLHAYVKAHADLEVLVFPRFRPGVYMVRNRWMVDRSARVIAVTNGNPGGTKNTMRYAEAQGVPIRAIQG